MNHSTAFDIYGTKIIVECEEPELAEGLRTLLGLFPSPDTTEDSWLMRLRRADRDGKGKPMAAVVPPNSTRTLVSNSSSIITMQEEGKLVDAQIAPGPAGPVMLVFPILTILQSRGVFVMHSAAFSDRSGKGFLFPGQHASGKTTIAFTALQSGCSIVADDVLLLRREGQDIVLLPFLAVLSFEEGKPTKRMFDVLRHYPREAFKPAINPRFVLFPKVTQQPTTTVTRIPDKRRVFELLLTHSLLVEEKSHQAQQLKILWEMAGRLASYELYLGQDHHASPEVLHDILEGAEATENC